MCIRDSYYYYYYTHNAPRGGRNHINAATCTLLRLRFARKCRDVVLKIRCPSKIVATTITTTMVSLTSNMPKYQTLRSYMIDHTRVHMFHQQSWRSMFENASVETAIWCTGHCSDLRSRCSSMRCDAINVTVKAAQNAFFNFQLFSVSRLDHVYLGRWGKGVPSI